MIAFKKNKYIILLSLFLGLFFSGCKDNWDEHNKIQDPMLSVNLLTQIKTNPDLSQFADLLHKTGYDVVVASSKTFTIWAPNNAAITAMDQTVLADTTKLKQFVANHISNQTYLTNQPMPVLTIRTLNGKNILFTKTTFEEANITSADRFVGNGVLHVVDKAIVPKPNVWEYVNSSAPCMQKAYLQALNYSYFNPNLGTVTGINPTTGLPIYKPGTGIVYTNYFLRKVDVSNEDMKYTYVILTDAAFTAEKAKLSKYFTYANALLTPAQNAALTDTSTMFSIVKDLTFKGDYSANLPDSITSVDSLRVHLDKSAIVETHKVSNGVVYVMSRVDYKMSSKIKPVIVQGTNIVTVIASNGATIYASMSSNSNTRTTLTRRNPFTGLNFTEAYVYNTGKSSFWYHYYPLVNSVTYHVYWMAVRDFNTTATPPATPVMFSQAITFGTPTILAALPYKQVDILNYNEVYIGDYTSTFYGNLDTFLVGAANTTNGQNSIVLSYIKMVPVIN